MNDRGHNEFCPSGNSHENGSCHCDSHLDQKELRMGMVLAGWKSHAPVVDDQPVTYFWRDLSETEAIQLNRHPDGWEFKWVGGENDGRYIGGFATPRHAIDQLWESMSHTMKTAAEYRRKIHNFRNALDGLKL